MLRPYPRVSARRPNAPRRRRPADPRLARPPRRRLGPILALAALVACGGEETGVPTPAPETAAAGGEVVVDLAALLPAAERRREVAELVLGEASARPYLVAGWGRDESDGEESFVWGLGEASTLDFFVARPRAFTLVLDGLPLLFPDAPAQTVELELGGESLQTLELAPRRRGYRVAVPASAVTTGRNRLRLRYGWHRAPAEVLPEAADRRRLAAQWYRVGFRGLGTGAAADAGHAGEASLLELPVRTSAAYHLEALPGRELWLDRVLLRPGDADAFLRVGLQLEGGAPAFHDLDPRTATFPWRLPLPAAPGRVLAVELAALDRDGRLARLLGALGRDDDDGLVLVDAAVRVVDGGETGETGGVETDPPAAGTAPPDVVVYLIDTLRADHLGVYGYERPVSPRIDRFAEDAAVFTHAEAQSSWTRTAVISLFTGLNAQSHRVNRRDEALPAAVDTLAEHLAGAGYETVGIVTNGNVAATFGLDQGFDRFAYLTESRERVAMHRLSDELNETAFPELERLARSEKPFFLYLHATDPHAPYTPPEPFASRFAAGVDPALGHLERVHAISRGERSAPAGTREAWIDLYDAEIAFNDHHFGRLLDRLQELGLYRDALIVLVSDHGEEFLEHGGWEHGKTLYAEQLRVPLIVKLPGGVAAGRRLDAVARQIDVLPTVLELVGVPVPAEIDGRSLLPLLRGAPENASPPSFSYLGLDARRMQAVVDRGHKAILDDSRETRAGRTQLYDVVRDPGETADLYAEQPLLWGFLRQQLLALRLRPGDALPTPDPAAIDDELRKRLEALGYVR